MATDSLFVIGTNHRLAPVDFREKVAFPPEEHLRFLQRARESLQSDCFLLSTCNRTELYTVGTDPTARRVWDLLSEFKAVDPLQDANRFYEYRGRDAVLQLFRVATGIDSQLLGETQILDQVKACHQASLQADTAGVVGERLLAAAIRCGKRARSETDISRGAISVAYAAVSLAHKVFADLSTRTALVVGAGETATLVAKSLTDHGIGQLWVLNRTLDRARALAATLRGEAQSLDALAQLLPSADLVICVTTAPLPLIDSTMVRTAMKQRQHRSLLVVDIGVPRNVDPEVGATDNVFLNDIDGLQGMIEQNLVRRRRCVPAVERIIEHEADRFLEWYGGLQVSPVIRELRERLEGLRDQELERLRNLTPDQRDAVRHATHGIINKLLHRPMTLLRDATSQGETGLRRIQTIREIFGLGGESLGESIDEPLAEPLDEPLGETVHRRPDGEGDERS